MLKFHRMKIWFDSAMNAFNTYTLHEALFMSLDFFYLQKLQENFFCNFDWNRIKNNRVQKTYLKP